jgi:hypothetical protein
VGVDGGGQLSGAGGFAVAWFGLAQRGVGAGAYGRLSAVQKQLNKVHNGLRPIGERGNSLLKMTFRALRNVSLDRGGSGRSSPRLRCSCTLTTAAGLTR